VLVVLEESKMEGRREREGEQGKVSTEHWKGEELAARPVYWFRGCDGLTFTDFIASLVMEAILARDTGGLESQMEFNCVRGRKGHRLQTAYRGHPVGCCR